jgi:hypothetical protein
MNDTAKIKCKNCGYELHENERPCPHCGSSQRSYEFVISTSMGLTANIKTQQFRESEFENYLVQLLELSSNFRKIKRDTRVSVKAWIRADIIAEEKTDGRWKNIVIECKSATTFTEDRLKVTIAKLISYQKLAPLSQLVFAFPGVLSVGAIQSLKKKGIQIWDLTFLSQLFRTEIPQVKHPIFQALLSGVKPPLVQTKEDNLINDLTSCPKGKLYWSKYQNLVGSILEQLFCPPLLPPLKENPDALAINRRDFIFPNYADNGFWSFLRDKFSADYIVVDAKNYSDKIGKNQVLQMANYLKSHGAGLFGLIVCRGGSNRSCDLTVNEVWIIEKKLIIILTDSDLKEMLTANKSGTDPEIIIRQKIEDFRLKL